MCGFNSCEVRSYGLVGSGRRYVGWLVDKVGGGGWVWGKGGEIRYIGGEVGDG